MSEDKRPRFPFKWMEQAKVILKLFDPELANNGQTWHENDILEQLEETYGPGNENEIRNAIRFLLSQGSLVLLSSGNYRRRGDS